MFSCPTGTYQCNADNSGSCKITLENVLTCGTNGYVVNSNTVGLNLSGAYCYTQSSYANSNNNNDDASYIACVPSLDKKTTSPGCKSGYTRCDSGGNNTCSIGPKINASSHCTDNFGITYSIKDIMGVEIPGALCHADSNTACRPVSDDCGSSCKPFETCVKELTNVCKAPPVCNPPCENNAQCIEDLKNPGNTMCDCTTASMATQLTDCFGIVGNNAGSPQREIKPGFKGLQCETAFLPNGFVTETISNDTNNKHFTQCKAITNGLSCEDGNKTSKADTFFYTCKDATGNCPVPDGIPIANWATVCGTNTGFDISGLNDPKIPVCPDSLCTKISQPDCGVCDLRTEICLDKFPYCFPLLNP